MDDYSSSIDQQLMKVYKNSLYRVEKPRLDLRIGELNEELNVFCFDNNVHSWAFISAHNPKSQVLPPNENKIRQEELQAEVSKKGWRCCQGEGIGEDPNWIPEFSLFILDISKKDAVALGRQFEQNAIVFGVFNQKPELIWINTGEC